MLLMLWFYFGSVLSSVIPHFDSLDYNVYLSHVICMHAGTPLHKRFPLPLESYNSR